MHACLRNDANLQFLYHVLGNSEHDANKNLTFLKHVLPFFGFIFLTISFLTIFFVLSFKLYV